MARPVFVLAIASLAMGCATRNDGADGEGEGSAEATGGEAESSADSQGDSGTSSASDDGTTTGPACVGWSESCANVGCCDPMHWCHPSSWTCVERESGTTEEDGGVGGEFIIEPDWGGGAIECDVWLQDCPTGDKCTAWANDGGNSWNATKCSPIDPDPDGVGEPCLVEGNGVSGVDSCVLGAMCFYVDGATRMGTCVGLCVDYPNPVCAQPGTECAIFNDGVLNLCLTTCDPLMQTCPAGQVCVPKASDPGFACFPEILPSADVGEECPYINTCRSGLVCASPDRVPGCTAGSGCCTDFCDVSAPVCSDPMSSCLTWWADPGDAISGLEDLGVCGLP